jgi:hypothetical protein
MAHDTAMNPTSKIVALSSAIAFALQIALALLMLRFFSPEEVGTFSVISQIGFFWTTLALAQAPLQLLANHGLSVFEDARLAWIASIKRFIWLLPIVALAVWWSGMSFVSTLLWALLLSLCQLTWMLAQSMRLRMASVWGQAGVRVLPPLIALLATATGIYSECSGFVLLFAALLGYAIGAAWLFPAYLKFLDSNSSDTSVISQSYVSTTSGISTATDDRSTALRMTHTLLDALLATAFVLVWQRLYGSQETGWLTALLRVMGFIPAVVHMAWAQVVLAQPQHTRTNSLWVGIGGVVCVALLGAGFLGALEFGWLSDGWQGAEHYLLSLVLWQSSACFVAAFSHLPFHLQSTRSYSWGCICAIVAQATVLIAPIFSTHNLTTDFHILLYGTGSAIILMILAIRLGHSHKFSY